SLGPALLTVTVYVTFWPCSTGFGEAVLVTPRLAPSTVVVCVAELLALFGSAVLLATVAVLGMVEPGVALAFTFTTSWNVAIPPFTNVGLLQDSVPPLPTGGGEQVKGGPDNCPAETNVVVAGTVSVSCTFCAASGPLFWTVMVYVRLLPACTGSGVS